MSQLIEAGPAPSRSSSENPDQQLCEEEVDDQDEHRGSNHGLRGRASHPLCSTLSREPEITADRGNNEAEEEWLEQALKDVGKLERLVCAGPILSSAKPQSADANDVSAEKPHEVGENRKEEEHD